MGENEEKEEKKGEDETKRDEEIKKEKEEEEREEEEEEKNKEEKEEGETGFLFAFSQRILEFVLVKDDIERDLPLSEIQGMSIMEGLRMRE